MTGSWNGTHRWINHGGKSGSGTCCSSFYLVWITRPWHLLKLFMQAVCSVSSLPARSRCEDLGRYQSLAHGIFIFSVTWDCVGVTPHWCIGSDCSWALTAHKAISKEIILPCGLNFPRIISTLKKINKGYVAFRSVSPLNSTYTCMCLERLERTGFSHITQHPYFKWNQRCQAFCQQQIKLTGNCSWQGGVDNKGLSTPVM